MTARKTAAPAPDAGAANYVDLDAFLDHEQPVFLVGGKEFRFPGRGDLPIGVMLKLQRSIGEGNPIKDADEAEVDAAIRGEWTNEALDKAGWKYGHLQNLNLALLAWHLAARGQGRGVAMRILAGAAGTPTSRPAVVSTSRRAPATSSTGGSGSARSTRKPA